MTTLPPGDSDICSGGSAQQQDDGTSSKYYLLMGPPRYPVNLTISQIFEFCLGKRMVTLAVELQHLTTLMIMMTSLVSLQY